jgi:ElaA protein
LKARGELAQSVRSPAVDWQWCRFEGLDVRRLQAIHRARQQVFVVEQACAFLDADVYDEVAFHLCAWSTVQAEPLAYARVIDPGAKHDEPSIGRVLTTSAARGQGLGRALVREAIVRTQHAWPGQGIRISAQSRLEPFYAAFGFAPVGEPYLDDGIAHTDMLLAWSER